MNFFISYNEIYFYICICNYKRNAVVITNITHF